MDFYENVTRISDELLQIERDESHHLSFNWTERHLEMLRVREQIRIDYYDTYDPMVGMRIALTLSGLFIIMVLMIFLKGRSEAEFLLKMQLHNNTVQVMNNESSDHIEMTLFRNFNIYNSQSKSSSSSSTVYDEYEESLNDNSIHSLIHFNMDDDCVSTGTTPELPLKSEHSNIGSKLAPLASISSCDSIFLVIDDKK